MPDDQTARPQPNITDLALKSWDILVDAVQRYNAQIAEINNKVDPSATTTGETPFPVPAPSDGGNASERDSQGVESADFTATVRTLIAAVNSGSAETAKKLHAILRGAGLIAPEPPASERPNAGRETDWMAQSEHNRILAHEIGEIAKANAARSSSWWEEAKRSRRYANEQKARADAAEAKLRVADEHHRMELGYAGELLKVAKRNHDADRALLDEIREALDNRLAYPSPAYAFAEIRAIVERTTTEPELGDVIKCQRCGQQSQSIRRGCSNCGHGRPSVEPKHGGNCSMYADRCVSMHCLDCGEPTGPQGHLNCPLRTTTEHEETGQ